MENSVDRLAKLSGVSARTLRYYDQIGLLKTISTKKGETGMSDREKFEGFKRRLVEENERKYGEEVRKKYGSDTVDASNARLMGLTEEQYAKAEGLSKEFNEALKTAMRTGDPAGPLAQNACALHRDWLLYFWKDYSREAHLGLAQTYVDDPRFRQYYDGIAPGGAEFLLEAMKVFCR